MNLILLEDTTDPVLETYFVMHETIHFNVPYVFNSLSHTFTPAVNSPSAL